MNTSTPAFGTALTTVKNALIDATSASKTEAESDFAAHLLNLIRVNFELVTA